MKEYQRFSPDSVNGSDSTAGLKRNIEKDDNKIIVTTIQKLNNLMKSEGDLAIYGKHVVFIFDECHRSQFGEAQKNLKKKFKRFYQFGFTGTPIFPQNAVGAETTASVFGRELHSYVITDAIRDEKVLKFKVEYNDVRPKFKAIETEQDEKKLTAAENRQALLHPERLREISQYILTHYRQKTHRLRPSGTGFNAMFAVSSIDAAKLYYESLKKLQAESERPLRVATIFSFAANEEQDAIGDIQDESFDVSAMNSSAKEFLNAAIADYNADFKTSFSVDSNGFQNYYRNLDQIPDKASVIEAFFSFVRSEQQRESGELIADENLNTDAAKRYISTSLKREFASDSGTELNSILPKMSPLNPEYLKKKQSVFQKIAAFVEKFKGVGGDV